MLQRDSAASPFNVLEETEEAVDHEMTDEPVTVEDGAFLLVKFRKKESIVCNIGKVIKHQSFREEIV